MNICLIGMPGCGKSTIGKILSERLQRTFFDCDTIIEEKNKMTISDIFDKYGEKEFRNMETAVCKELSSEENAVISTGGGCVERKENIDALKKNGVIFFIDRNPENISSDLDTSNRPLFKNTHLTELYKRRYSLYNQYCSVNIPNNGNVEDAIQKILCEVKKYENNGN